MTLLTNTEFSQLYAKAQLTFAAKSLAEMSTEVYGIRKGSITAVSERLWLYVFALESWDNTDIDNNYMTERQMITIISKVQKYAS